MAAQTPVKSKDSPVIDLTFSPPENVEDERVRLYREVDRERGSISRCQRKIQDKLDRISEIESNLLSQSKSELSSSNKRSTYDDDSSEGTILSEPIIFGTIGNSRKRKLEITTFYHSS